MACLLCERPESVGAIVYDDGRVLVILHDDWAVAGHALVVTREHVQNASALADAAHFWDVYGRAEAAILHVAGAERAMMLKLGIVVPHLHVHIYPMSAAADRGAVFAAFDGTARTDLPPEEERKAFVEAVRARLA
jgi:diadenosine tetraphosphate (Ap4A) HIT family hydrolase